MTPWPYIRATANKHKPLNYSLGVFNGKLISENVMGIPMKLVSWMTDVQTIEYSLLTYLGYICKSLFSNCEDNSRDHMLKCNSSPQTPPIASLTRLNFQRRETSLKSFLSLKSFAKHWPYREVLVFSMYPRVRLQWDQSLQTPHPMLPSIT